MWKSERSVFAESGGFALWGMLFMGLLAGCMVLILGMFVSMVRMDIGHERRQFIVGKSGIFSFVCVAGYLLLETVVTIVCAQRMEVDPFVILTSMAVMFTLALAWNKYK